MYNIISLIRSQHKLQDRGRQKHYTYYNEKHEIIGFSFRSSVESSFVLIRSLYNSTLVPILLELHTICIHQKKLRHDFTVSLLNHIHTPLH